MKNIASPRALALVAVLPFALGFLARPSADQAASARQGPGWLALTPEQAQILGHMRLVQVEDAELGSLPTLVIEGLNVQIVNGLGATNGYRPDPYSLDPALVQTNGLGNLILGYNEPQFTIAERSGSHGLVLGIGNDYTSFGAIVSGALNEATAPHASAIAGSQNTASGNFAVALGGTVNMATGLGAVTAGGGFNLASEAHASVVGGTRSLASGPFSSVAGGYKSVATGDAASVHGGALNRADGNFSTVSGGRMRLAPGPYDWAAGSLFEDE